MEYPVIDVFCHWLPAAFAPVLERRAQGPRHMLTRSLAMPAMVELDTRFRIMDQFPGYRQIPSLVSPPLEVISPPEESPELARLANDSMAEIVARHPDRFPGFVAVLPMNNPDAAMEEARRVVRELNACGVQIFTNVNGRPLDVPEYFQLFGVMAELDRPVWLHPARGMTVADYPCEMESQYELWWTLGWPYETSVAAYRLVFAGLFERWPSCTVITHHAGGLLPMVKGRLGPGLELYGTRTPAARAAAVATPLRERPLDAFRRFYADTATFGSRAAIACGLSFFGAQHLLFGSDMPFDPEQGPGYIRDTLRALRELELAEDTRTGILSGNITTLLHLAQ